MAFGEWFKKIYDGTKNVASTAYNKIGEAKDNTYKYLGKEFVVKPTITKGIADVGIPALSTFLKSKGGTLGYMTGHAMDYFNDKFLGGDSSNNNQKYEKIMNDYNAHIQQRQREEQMQLQMQQMQQMQLQREQEELEKKRKRKEKKKKKKKQQKKLMKQLMMLQNKNNQRGPIVEEVFDDDLKMLK